MIISARGLTLNIQRFSWDGNMTKYLLSILLIGLLFIFSGCAWFSDTSPEVEKSAQELAKEGTLEFKEGNYTSAIEAFTTLRDWYPFSKYAILAELKIADAHYKKESYEEALIAYQEFENLHPKNDTIPYIIYQSGMCWYKRLTQLDQDQTPARKAIEQFQRLTHRFPNDPLSQKSAKKIKRCVNSIAAHEAYVADFYLKAKHYKAALKRYEGIVANYPDTDVGKIAPEKIARCKKMMAEIDASEK